MHCLKPFVYLIFQHKLQNMGPAAALATGIVEIGIGALTSQGIISAAAGYVAQTVVKVASAGYDAYKFVKSCTQEGLKLKGRVGYTLSQSVVELRAEKITHDYDKFTGIVRLQLCKNYWFYQNCSKYNDYDIIAEVRLQKMGEDQYYGNLRRTVPRLCQGESYNRCFTLFLEEFTNQGWKMRDYRDFT